MVYYLALRSRKKIPVVLGGCLSTYTVNKNNFLSKSPPKRTDWRLKTGMCSGIFMTFICRMRELKADGLWVQAGKQIKYFHFSTEKYVLALLGYLV